MVCILLRSLQPRHTPITAMKRGREDQCATHPSTQHHWAKHTSQANIFKFHVRSLCMKKFVRQLKNIILKKWMFLNNFDYCGRFSALASCCKVTCSCCSSTGSCFIAASCCYWGIKLHQSTKANCNADISDHVCGCVEVEVCRGVYVCGCVEVCMCTCAHCVCVCVCVVHMCVVCYVCVV